MVDPAEMDFPFEEPTLFHDLESPQVEFVDARGVQAAYRREFRNFADASRRLPAIWAWTMRAPDRHPVEQALSSFLLCRRGARHGRAF